MINYRSALKTIQKIALEASSTNQTFFIELNGIANMNIILDEYASTYLVQKEFVDKMREQLNLTERYMIEVAKAAQEGRQPAMWHEVRENKDKYELNGGRLERI